MFQPDYYKDAPHFHRVGDGPEYRLEIPCAKLDYTGAYSVIAKNCYGEAKAVISLQITAKGESIDAFPFISLHIIHLCKYCQRWMQFIGRFCKSLQETSVLKFFFFI